MYSISDVPTLEGRVALITGANTGIGFETARVLAGKGARVLLGCRSRQKAEDAIARITAEHPEAELRWVPLDLASLGSVREAAKIVRTGEPRLNLLINNAGVMMPPYTLTEDGFELQFGVNHLAHFALTGLLLDGLLAQNGSRIVNVSSLAHRSGFIDFVDPQAKKLYGAQTRYQMSKLANLLFTLELQRRLEQAKADCLAVACHPGIADTELGRYMPGWINLLLPVARPFFNSATEGALPTLQAATDPGVRGGEYYGPVARGETARGSGLAIIHPRARNAEAATRLWKLSEELTGVHFTLTP